MRRLGASPSDEAIYRDIYTAIVEHHLRPGTKLSEDALAGVFGVSRTRIRKVLHRLAHENIATLHRNRGAFVAKPSTKEAREVFATRRLLETAAVAAVAAQADANQIRRLRRFVVQERSAHEAHDQRAMIKLSGEFHLELIGLLGNETLVGFLRELVSRTSLVIAVYERPGPSSCHHDEHARLVEHVAERDADKSAEAMRQHLQGIEDSLDLEDTVAPKVNLRQVFAQLADRRASEA